MSLFGEESRSSKSQQALFGDTSDDDAATPFAATAQKTTAGLFGDDIAGKDAWDFPTPKKVGRNNLVKTLLPSGDVPDSYIDTFDALLETGERDTRGARVDELQDKILSKVGLSQEQQAHILHIISPNGRSSHLDRAEFNVLLALIGLAQEEEEVSLDSVDDRRRRLPLPKLPKIVGRRAIQQPAVAENTYVPSTTPINAAATSAYQQSLNIDNSPWGSPDQSRTNGTTADSHTPRVRESQRTTSNFSSTGMDTSNDASGGVPASADVGSAWGVYNSEAGMGYQESSSMTGGFVSQRNDEEEDGIAQPKPMRTAVDRHVSEGEVETVVVNLLPEKEGTFLFQYRNYELTSARRNSTVARRYSDFVWLLDCLHKRYPFRLLPLLPPKRVAINGNHIAADNLFLDKRRRGLTRFANAIVTHPVLAQDQLVIMFLTVPTELSAWRKQAAISIQEEFTGKPLPPTLEESLPSTLDELFETVRSGVRRSAEMHISLCSLVERLLKRRMGLSTEYVRMSTLLRSITETSADTYRIDTNDVPMLNEGIKSTANHVSQHQAILDDESRAWDLGFLEDLKTQRDSLVGMRDLFDRKDRLSKDNIPQLEKRIRNNESKLEAVRAKPDAQRKPGESEKLEDALMKDKQAIVDQHARSVFIKECVRDEVQHFQVTQYRISRLHQDWAAERIKYGELQAENWRSLYELVESMPVRSS